MTAPTVEPAGVSEERLRYFANRERSPVSLIREMESMARELLITRQQLADMRGALEDVQIMFRLDAMTNLPQYKTTSQPSRGKCPSCGGTGRCEEAEALTGTEVKCADCAH